MEIIGTKTHRQPTRSVAMNLFQSPSANLSTKRSSQNTTNLNLNPHRDHFSFLAISDIQQNDPQKIHNQKKLGYLHRRSNVQMGEQFKKIQLGRQSGILQRLNQDRYDSTLKLVRNTQLTESTTRTSLMTHRHLLSQSSFENVNLNLNK